MFFSTETQSAGWTEFYENYGRDYYLMGPEFDKTVPAGKYKIEVYSKDLPAQAGLTPLLETIVKHVPSASSASADAPLIFQAFNLAYDNFLGRMAVARIYQGIVAPGLAVFEDS